MKKNGFSLIELLAVIVVLGLIITISIPLVNKSIVKSKDKALVEQKNQIIKAAQKYALKHSDVLPDNTTGPKKISIETLIDNKYIEKEEVLNPVTEEKMVGCVKIEYMKNNVEYYYTYEDTCS